MSSFRPGRGHNDSRRSVFYTNEEWELLEPSPKELEESMVQEERKKQVPEGSKGMDVVPVCRSRLCHLLTPDAVGDPLVTGITRSVRPSGSSVLSVGNKT